MRSYMRGSCFRSSAWQRLHAVRGLATSIKKSRERKARQLVSKVEAEMGECMEHASCRAVGNSFAPCSARIYASNSKSPACFSISGCAASDATTANGLPAASMSPAGSVESAHKAEPTAPHSFKELGVSAVLVRLAAALHIRDPSPIQILALPHAFCKKDVLGIAPTGTGKTLCYCWPLLQRIASGQGHAFMGLVLLPARELAIQVLEQFRIYGTAMGARVCVLLGGRDLVEESRFLSQQLPHILIATPGRLADHLQNDFFVLRKRLSVVEVLVLDEADMLLSDEFEEDLKRILECLPPSRAKMRNSKHKGKCGSPSIRMHASAAADIEGKTIVLPARTAGGSRASSTVLETAESATVVEEVAVSTVETAAAGGVKPASGKAGLDIGDAPEYACQVTTPVSNTCSVKFDGLPRQTLLFSATVSPALLALQHRFGDQMLFLDASASLLPKQPQFQLGDQDQQGPRQQAEQRQQMQVQGTSVGLPTGLSHYYMFVPGSMRLVYLLYLLTNVPPFSNDRGIVFAGSVRQTQQLCTALEVLQEQATPLHSLMSQRRRVACLEKFRSESARLLICTDVAGRGLDLPKVEFVISLETPLRPELYIHRTGRTARAGRKGIALTFVEPKAVRALHRIEAAIGRKLQPLESVREADVLQHLSNFSKVLQKAALFLSEIGFEEKADKHAEFTKMSKEFRRRRRATLNAGATASV